MVIANSIKTSTPNYVITDISLSDFGRKEIKIAETEMPGLMALRDKYLSCLLYTSPSPRDGTKSRMPSSA